MKRKIKKTHILAALLLVLLGTVNTHAAQPALVSVTGCVKQPLNLALTDLERYQSVTVQLNGVMEDGSYQGVFYYTGIPLRTLLETAFVQKEETAFSKQVDMAVRVKNREGKQVALSWGEIFFKNPARIILATSARPIMPHHDCKACHTPEEYEPRLDQLNRKIGFPKLVVAGDAYADRCLEDVSTIQVLDLRPGKPTRKMKELFSPECTITGRNVKTTVLRDLSGRPRQALRVKHLGQGKGYHGINVFEGVSFKGLLEEAGVKRDLSEVFLISAPDGYRSLFSYGEVFLDALGDRIILADKMAGKPLKQGGKFFLIPPDDLMADRDVKAAEKVEILSLKTRPKVSVIGVGCGDTSLISLEAVSRMAGADAYVCPPDIRKRFARYMGDKSVLFDLYEFAPPVLRKKHPELSQEALKKLTRERQVRAAGIIKKRLQEGMNVAILDYGDPTIWSGWSWAREFFKGDTLEIVPGLSSFNVANALLGSRIDCNGSIILTTPREIKKNMPLLKSLAEEGQTICIFMGLKDLPNLVPLFRKYYNENTPASLVYKAGYSSSEHVIQTTLGGVQKAADEYPEKFLGLIYIGPCLAVREGEDCE
ncbi:MAG: SAM-dependent methyltransferase [Desulfatiglandaceae bacterium]|jgi:precorrin-4 methylase